MTPKGLVILLMLACIYIYIYQHLLKDGRLRNQKQNVHQHQTGIRENGSSFDFIFISLLSPLVDENWVIHIMCAALFVFEK